MGAARRFARQVLAAEQRETLDAVELMVSELATNCVRHARSEFEILIDEEPTSIRIEVQDRGEGSPTVRSPTPEELTGRGLMLVEALSETWGVDPRPTGKTVWFTIPAGRAAA